MHVCTYSRMHICNVASVLHSTLKTMNWLGGFLFLIFHSDIHFQYWCVRLLDSRADYPSWFYMAFIKSDKHEWLSIFRVDGIHVIETDKHAKPIHTHTHVFIHRHVDRTDKWNILVVLPFSIILFFSLKLFLHSLLLLFLLCHWKLSFIPHSGLLSRPSIFFSD